MTDATQPCFIDPFKAFPIKLAHHRIFLSVAINGAQTVGVMDTGASFSLVTPEMAAKAGVTMQKGGNRVQGVAGAFSTKIGIAKEVQFGSVKAIGPRRLHVFPFGGSHADALGVQLGLDWLQGLDYDLDVRHETITPYGISNCATIDPPWHNDYTGVIVKHEFETSGRDFNLLDALFNRQISIPVVFPNGQAVEATFDTGSTDSLLSYDAALNAGLTGSTIRGDPMITAAALDGRPKQLHQHKFAVVSVGNEDLHDFTVAVEPHFDRRSTPMLLGMDYIGTHRFWISFTTGAIYIDSGKLRQKVPPFDEPRQIGGAKMPAYPAEANGRKGSVSAICTVEADGSLTGCSAALISGPEAYRQSVLEWLRSSYGPIMQPAYVNNSPVRRTHSWQVSFNGK